MIAVVITTFLRPMLAMQAADSVLRRWNPDYQVLMVSQGFEHNLVSTQHCAVILAPFDCGLSMARNIGVRHAEIFGCEYTIISADSIMFTETYDFAPVLAVMKQRCLDLVGFELEGRPAWEGKLTLDPSRGYPFKVEHDTTLGNWKIPVDITRNFFIARTDSLRAVQWDQSLKLREHEDWFWRYKLAGYRCGWTNTIKAAYCDMKPDNYVKYRNRMYHEFELAVREKWSKP